MLRVGCLVNSQSVYRIDRVRHGRLNRTAATPGDHASNHAPISSIASAPLVDDLHQVISVDMSVEHDVSKARFAAAAWTPGADERDEVGDVDLAIDDVRRAGLAVEAPVCLLPRDGAGGGANDVPMQPAGNAQ